MRLLPVVLCALACAHSTSSTSDSSASSSSSGGAVTAAQILTLTQNCTPASSAGYKTDDESGLPSDISICRLNGAFFWHADMDVDCDGKTTAQCNLTADPAYQDQTSLEDSHGQPLDAATLPYIVVPLPSTRFDYMQQQIELGAVALVVYNGQLAYGIFGDEGPDSIIGEASYAMAQSLGIDPDPSTGGTDSGVTYVVFTGASAVVAKPEDHAQAVTLGQMLASQLVANN